MSSVDNRVVVVTVTAADPDWLAGFATVTRAGVGVLA